MFRLAKPLHSPFLTLLSPYSSTISSALVQCSTTSSSFRLAHTKTKQNVSEEEVNDFTKKVGRVQRKFGLKGASKYLSMEREMWHLRHKKPSNAPTVAAEDRMTNKQFRSIAIDPEIMKYVDTHKLGLRRDSGKTKETRVMQYRTEYIPKLKFVAGATQKLSFIDPDPELLEVAFVGRSNVGKSSLINTLTSSGTARTSDTPGETRSINWLQWGNRMYIVDLPGYGFAYASPDHKEQWQNVMREYLTNRKTLRRVMVLLDARHGVKASDMEMFTMLNEAKKRFQIVLTKVDVVEPNDLARRCSVVNEETRKFKYLIKPTLMVSAKKNQGLDLLRKEIARFSAKDADDKKRQRDKELWRLKKEQETQQTNKSQATANKQTTSKPNNSNNRNNDQEQGHGKQGEGNENEVERDEEGKVFKERHKIKKIKSKNRTGPRREKTATTTEAEE